MMKNLPSIAVIKNSLSFSLRTTILIMLIVVSLIPLAFIFPSLAGDSRESAYKDNLKMHKLLASSLIDPISLKLESYQHELKLLDIELQATSFQSRQKTQNIINKFNKSHGNMVSVSLLLLSNSNSPIIGVRESLKVLNEKESSSPEYIAKELKYQKYDQKDSISPIMKSSFSGSPILLLKHQIIDNKFKKIGTLFAEIEPKFIQKICNNISFGNKGHCIIVDNKSKTIAHPNQAWVSQVHNLSSHKLVQKLRSSNVGSLEYNSTTDNIPMIGGYAKIQNLNWGVIITRPKAEIDLPLNEVRMNTLQWLIIGLAFSLLIAIITIFKVTRPLKILSNKSKLLTQKQSTYLLGSAPKNSTSDIAIVWKTLSDLLGKYQELLSNNTLLESSSKKDIRKVMSRLREQNIKKKNNVDSVTGLTNITCFLEEVRKSLLLYRGEVAGLIIIEIDNCESLIAEGSKQLATHIIKHVAQILNTNKRNDDLVAHYGDGGRFAIFINECSPKALQGMAKKMRSLVEVSPIQWKNDTVYINLSTGIVAHKINDKTTVDSLILSAEKALDASKKPVENKTSTHENKEAQPA